LKSALTLDPPSDGAVAVAEGDMIAGRYRLLRQVGEGATGVVWAAEHTVTRRKVALKLLKTEREDARRRFVREARIAVALRHPNIVEVLDVLEASEAPAPTMVMELLEGRTLARILAERKKLDLAETARVLLPVARAVKEAHARGIVHRDLKPDNVIVCDDGAIKVLDFGIAKVQEGSVVSSGVGLTRTGAIVGTPSYMAPEQVFGEADVDQRADVWAVGVMLYETLSGARPFEGENFGQVFKNIAMTPVVPLGQRCPELPEAVTRLVGRMLARERDARPADLEEVCAVLAGEHPPAKRSRRWYLAALPVAILPVALVAVKTAPPAGVVRSLPPVQMHAIAPEPAPPAPLPPPPTASAVARPTVPAARAVPASSVSAPPRPKLPGGVHPESPYR
jgi:serine/threonine-protein kinase